MASQHISLPDLPPDQLVAWCNETSWLNTHGKLVRSHVSEDTHKELKPIFSIIKEENAERIAFDDLVEMFTVCILPSCKSCHGNNLISTCGKACSVCLHGVWSCHLVLLATAWPRHSCCVCKSCRGILLHQICCAHHLLSAYA